MVYQYEAALRAREHRRRNRLPDIVNALRAGLARAGIDPAAVPAMGIFAEGSIFAPRPAPAPQPPQSRIEKLREELLSIVRRHREAPLDLHKANLLELYAVYCFDEDAPGVGCLAPD